MINPIDEISKLHELHSIGALSSEEFKSWKEVILYKSQIEIIPTKGIPVANGLQNGVQNGVQNEKSTKYYLNTVPCQFPQSKTHALVDFIKNTKAFNDVVGGIPQIYFITLNNSVAEVKQ
jgi:hypothetical protein